MARTKGSLNERLWRDTLRRAALDYAQGKTGPRKIEIVARQLMNAAMAGDVAAAKEIGDRLDGKAVQTIDANITDERSVIRAPAPSQDATTWRGDYAPLPTKPH